MLKEILEAHKKYYNSLSRFEKFEYNHPDFVYMMKFGLKMWFYMIVFYLLPLFIFYNFIK